MNILQDRDLARELHKKHELPFFEVHVNTPLEECEKRDVKGLYKKARAGIIKGFTGIDQAYETPDNPELSLDTVGRTIQETVLEVIQMLENAVSECLARGKTYPPPSTVAAQAFSAFLAPWNPKRGYFSKFHPEF